MKKRRKIGFLAETRATNRPTGRLAVEKTDPRHVFGGTDYYLVGNIGAENRVLFSSQEDFDRFEAYLYLLNSTESPRAANFFLHGRVRNIYETGRGQQLVAIGAYAFTAKEFFILITPLIAGGMGKFMQKLQTGYTMYFNRKYGHSGRVFHAAYRADVAISDDELKFFFAKTHLHPMVLFDPEWEATGKDTIATLARRVLAYKYSSIKEYDAKKFVITSPEFFPEYIPHLHTRKRYANVWVSRRTSSH